MRKSRRWLAVTEGRAYPKPGRFFAPVSPERPLFQGDIFRGGFGAFWRHPANVQAAMSGLPLPTDPTYPELPALLASVLVRGEGYAILIPQPCEFSELEKGATHPFRLVAPVFPLTAKAGIDQTLVRQGRVGHAFWLPRWGKTGVQDYYVDLRLTASIDATFLTRSTRVAALSMSAWVTLADRLSRYFVGIPLDAAAFAVEQGHLHPDAR